MRVVKKESGPNVEIRQMLFRLLNSCMTVRYDVCNTVDIATQHMEVWDLHFHVEDQLADALYGRDGHWI